MTREVLIEVQHASDADLDGKWYELDRFEHDGSPDAMVYANKREIVLRDSYAGRPVRVTVVNK